MANERKERNFGFQNFMVNVTKSLVGLSTKKTIIDINECTSATKLLAQLNSLSTSEQKSFIKDHLHEKFYNLAMSYNSESDSYLSRACALLFLQKSSIVLSDDDYPELLKSNRFCCEIADSISVIFTARLFTPENVKAIIKKSLNERTHPRSLTDLSSAIKILAESSKLTQKTLDVILSKEDFFIEDCAKSIVLLSENYLLTLENLDLLKICDRNLYYNLKALHQENILNQKYFSILTSVKYSYNFQNPASVANMIILLHKNNLIDDTICEYIIYELEFGDTIQKSLEALSKHSALTTEKLHQVFKKQVYWHHFPSVIEYLESSQLSEHIANYIDFFSKNISASSKIEKIFKLLYDAKILTSINLNLLKDKFDLEDIYIFEIFAENNLLTDTVFKLIVEFGKNYDRSNVKNLVNSLVILSNQDQLDQSHQFLNDENTHIILKIEKKYFQDFYDALKILQDYKIFRVDLFDIIIKNIPHAKNIAMSAVKLSQAKILTTGTIKNLSLAPNYACEISDAQIKKDEDRINFLTNKIGYYEYYISPFFKSTAGTATTLGAVALASAVVLDQLCKK